MRFVNKPRLSIVTLLLVSTFLIYGCASSGTGNGGFANAEVSQSARITVCRTGDREVAGASQCLADDAACYQIANGNYCTGPRGNVCPTGSVAVPNGTPCPEGVRCFKPSESLYCAIQ